MKRDELEKLLTENIPDLEEKDLWIWGASNTACLYQEGLDRIGFSDKIVGYIDSDRAKWEIQGEFYGKPIICPNALKKYTDICVLICSWQANIINEIKRELIEMNVEAYFIDEVILKCYHEDVLKCYDLLCDDASKNIYAELIKSHLRGEYPDRNIALFGDQYFMWDRLTYKDIGETFVDCGAYVGDTIEKYIWYKDGVFKQIIGIEPDVLNFSALEQRKKRLCAEWNIEESAIQIINCGVADQEKTCGFVRNVNGLGSRIIEDESDGMKTEIITLDDYLKEPYSFLKADIESFEYKMLLGAKNGIRLWKPCLAICIYHNAIDLFSIVPLIHSFVPEYRIAIRHHRKDFSETVLYAWIE